MRGLTLRPAADRHAHYGVGRPPATVRLLGTSAEASDVTGRRPSEDTTVTADFVVDVGVTDQGVCNNL